MGLIQRLVALHKADQDPLKTKESFTTMHNYEGRKQEHDSLLREYGFPSEQDEAAMRYQRFSEEDSDPDSPDGVTHTRPPWLVNEASEMVAEINDEDAPSFKDSDKAKNRAGEKTASVSKGLVGRLVNLYKVSYGESFSGKEGDQPRLTPGQKQTGKLMEDTVRYKHPNKPTPQNEDPLVYSTTGPKGQYMEMEGGENPLVYSAHDYPNEQVKERPPKEFGEKYGTNLGAEGIGYYPQDRARDFDATVEDLPSDADKNVKMELMTGSAASRMKRQNKRGVTSGAQRMRGW